MDEVFEARLDSFDGVAVMSVVGEVDVATAPRFAACLDEVPVTAPMLVIDLSEVSLLDSTGLGVLLKCNERTGGGRVRLVAPSPQLRKVFAIVALDQVLPIFATLTEALAEP